MAPKGSKKYQQSINSRLSLVMKSGKAKLGIKQTFKAIRTGEAKVILLAANCPPLMKSQFHYYSMLNRIPVVNFSGNNIELGNACGKLFRCAALAVTDEGESKIMEMVEN
eukprot:TRINITY_DN2395_c0_g1_i2.p1 TRINITY_DN2395_c0_g1~~TRINITY_DN2395_c0_g1_i2.p1  ORF type:complete len:110 (+),score=20.46 TRINITY_DN2395_c0_g1_i2:29-358(+)